MKVKKEKFEEGLNLHIPHSSQWYCFFETWQKNKFFQSPSLQTGMSFLKKMN
jgi:hypothetical protein